jgi:hypothetical protein
MSGKEDLLKGKKILIVDDEPDILDTLEGLLVEPKDFDYLLYRHVNLLE